MSILSSVTQKMNQLRLEADDSAAKVEELQGKVKTLEQENLSKEQDITSLQHKNGLLEGEVEKLETAIKDFKKAAEDGSQHSTTNEGLTRRLQLLEEEAEEADKTLREANEKWVAQYYTFKSHDYLTWRCLPHCPFPLLSAQAAPAWLRPTSVHSWLNADASFFRFPGSGKPMSRRDTSSEKSRPSSPSETSGSPSTRRCPRSTQTSRRSWRNSRPRSATSKMRWEGDIASTVTFAGCLLRSRIGSLVCADSTGARHCNRTVPMHPSEGCSILAFRRGVLMDAL